MFVDFGVGRFEGTEDGKPVGAGLLSADEIKLGAPDGKADRELLGPSEGTEKGASDSVGLCVGAEVGPGVGTAVGLRVAAVLQIQAARA